MSELSRRQNTNVNMWRQRERYYSPSLLLLVPLLGMLSTPGVAFSALPLQPSPRPSAVTLRAECGGADASTPVATRRSVLGSGLGLVATVALVLPSLPAVARLESVNRPDLLPKEPNQNVIQVEKFLTTGQARRVDELLAALERDTGFRVRVLCQAYPNTPGLAIRDYWDLGKEGQKDDKYVVLVVDQFDGKGNVLNFNVGEGVKLNLPNVFWTRLQGRYGTLSYVRENGIDLAVINAIESIVSCLRSEDQYCVQPPDAAPSMRSLGMR